MTVKIERNQPMDTIISPRRRRLVLGLGACGAVGGLSMAGCGRPDARRMLQFGGETMGSTYRVKLMLPAGGIGAAQADVHAALDAVDRRMSMFRADSELSGFNRAGTGPFAISDELFRVFEAAQQVSRWSDGAFDITVAPLVEAWGFGTVGRRAVPAAAELRGRRTAVDWRGLVLERASRTVAKASGSMQADLGGIAKGYGVDAAAAALERRGVEHYMVDVGGEVRTRGRNAQGEAWRIGIEEPDALPQRARHVVPLSGLAMATSGDYRNYFELDGQRYSHEIDPVSGAPITHALASVTVVAGDCLRADALATALIVLGPERGPALAEASGIAAQFIVRRGGALSDHETRAFSALRPAQA